MYPVIMDIDITAEQEDFKNAVKKEIEKCNSTQANGTMHCGFKDKQLRSNKKVMIAIITNSMTGDTFSIAAQEDAAGSFKCYKFRPMKIRNFGNANSDGNSYYECVYGSVININDYYQDPCKVMFRVLSDLCKKYSGTLIYAYPVSDPVIIKDGSYVNVNGIAAVDESGKVYSDVCITSDSIDVGIPGEVKIGTLITEYIKAKPDLNSQLQGKQLDEKMDTIGLYLMNGKLSGQIDKKEFDDIFMQAGSIGFSNSTLAMIYKLLF